MQTSNPSINTYLCRPLLEPSGHDRAAFLGAEVCYGAIEHVDLVEEIHSWKRNTRQGPSRVRSNIYTWLSNKKSIE